MNTLAPIATGQFSEADAPLRKVVQGFLWGLAILIAGLFLSPVRKIPPADFMQFYFAGRLVVSGQASEIYNRAAYEPLVAELRAQGESIPPYPYLNRPAFYAYFCAPLGLVSYRTGLVATFVLNVLLLIVLVWKLPIWFRLSSFVRPSLFVFFPFLWAIAHGQDTILLTLLVALAIRYIEQRRETLAGVLLGLAAFKPHAIWLVPFALLASRKWPALRSFCVTGIVLSAVSFATVGFQGLSQWIDLLRAPSTDIFPQYMGNLRALYLRLGWLALLLAATLLAGALWTILRRGGFSERMAAALLGSLALNLHTYAPDYSVAALAAALTPFAPLRWLVFVPWPYLDRTTGALSLLLMSLVFLSVLALRLNWLGSGVPPLRSALRSDVAVPEASNP